MMKKLSLRLRLIFLFIIISCTVFACAGFLAWNESKDKADEFFDTYQMALARTLAGGNWKNIGSDTQHSTNKLIKKIRNAEDDDDAIGFAVFDKSGKMIFHDNENGKDFKYLPKLSNFDNQKVDGDMWRIVWTASADDNFIIAVGQELEYREDMAWDIMEEFMSPWVAGIITLLIMMIAIISFELAPLGKIATNIKNRKPDDFSPLEDHNIPSEIKPLTQAMNFRLAQISDLLQHERHFISDAAHELRTPLTALKIQLDVAKMSADDPKAQNETINKIGEGLNRATRLVEQLLALSRLEVNLKSSQLQNQKLCWGNVISQTIGECEFAANAKNQVITTNITGTGPFENGDSSLAGMIVRNLVDNAIKYSPKDAQISVNCGDNSLSVINSGIKVSNEHLRKLCERFFRIPGQNEKGSGLGLSIVECIADFYNCKLEFANTDNGFMVKISP
ncbi:MAG: sensor histidine kinase N-terminal domain-containing protein, partial [Alphaproteobacteria bacterium]|nr:sensor histidine kinase N-terminal domain-containing protein [Alphaproteobacteria bacterium]